MTSKILFILHLPPPIHGAAMMGKYIQESKVINTSFDCRFINLATASNLSDIGHIGFKKVWKYLGLLKHIFQTVRKLRPDLIYITPNAGGVAFLKDFVVVQILKAMGCKVIAHYHNKGVTAYQDKWIYNFLYRHFFKHLKVILLAEALYKDVACYVERKNVFICPNGIPILHRDEQWEKPNNEVTHLLFLSNLLVSKGVFVLLDALQILTDKGYTFICQLVGGETAEINTEQFAKEVKKRVLEKYVTYMGRKVGTEKELFFRQTDVFVFPTYNECFPLVVLEAMARKLPVVTTNEGGIPDIVEDGINGLICEKQNAKSLARCIARLLDDKDLRTSMGEAGFKKFKQQYTINVFEQKLTQILEQALADIHSNNLSE